VSGAPAPEPPASGAVLPSCPLPETPSTVELGHGGGGRLTRKLLESLFWAELGAPAEHHDGAVLSAGVGRPVLTTDAFVVKPLFFPGGDIGRLAVFGTVNDLAMCGAVARHLTASFILEEGLELELLRRVVRSLSRAADEVGVRVVAGDTKVVERGHGDQLFIAMSGLGWVAEGIEIGPQHVAPGDRVLVSGDIGRHGIAVLAARENLALSGEIESDCAELKSSVAELLAAGVRLHCLRDLTRGGLAAAVWEIARDGGVDLSLDEQRIPVSAGVRGAAELFGFEAMALPCEGRFVAFVPEADVPAALAALTRAAPGLVPQVIGRALERAAGRPARVLLRTQFGTERELELPHGELLPRIC
jgi:hydrogenase expression/formation protein HypE